MKSTSCRWTEETKESIEERKDEESGRERKVIRRPVAVVTVRKVYRTIIVTETGEEVGTDDRVEEEDLRVGDRRHRKQ